MALDYNITSVVRHADCRSCSGEDEYGAGDEAHDRDGKASPARLSAPSPV